MNVSENLLIIQILQKTKINHKPEKKFRWHKIMYQCWTVFGQKWRFWVVLDRGSKCQIPFVSLKRNCGSIKRLEMAIGGHKKIFSAKKKLRIHWLHFGFGAQTQPKAFSEGTLEWPLKKAMRGTKTTILGQIFVFSQNREWMFWKISKSAKFCKKPK